MGYGIGEEDAGIDNVLVVNSHVVIIFLCFIINIYTNIMLCISLKR